MSDSISLQKVGQKDMRAVVELLKTFADINDVKLIKLLESRLHSDRRLLLLAKDDTTPVGLLECTVHESITLLSRNVRGVINLLVVLESHRRQGIATKLLDASGFWFSGHGVENITCELPSGATEAEAFFAKQKFETIAAKVSKPVGN